MGPRLDGRVLRRESERVEPEWAEHALAQHGLIANGQVTEGVVAHVALVRRPRRVGVHAQRVELLPRVVVVDLVRPRFFPVALPLLFDSFDVVRPSHPTRVGEEADDVLVNRTAILAIEAGRSAQTLLIGAGGNDNADLVLARVSTTRDGRGASGQRHHEYGHRQRVLAAADAGQRSESRPEEELGASHEGRGGAGRIRVVLEGERRGIGRDEPQPEQHQEEGRQDGSEPTPARDDRDKEEQTAGRTCR